MIVTTDKQGRFSVRVGSLWHRHLSEAEARKLGVSSKDIATARARHDAMALKLPRYNGRRFVADGLEWSIEDTIADLRESLGFSRADAMKILEVSKLIHRIERATGFAIET